MKYKNGKLNEVIDAVSEIVYFLQEVKTNSVGFEILNDLYADDGKFKFVHEVCNNIILRCRRHWAYFMLYKIFLFKGNESCIPIGSMTNNLLNEKYCGILSTKNSFLLA